MTRPPAPKHSLRRKLCGCLFAIPESAPKLYSDKAYDFNDWEWHKNAAWRHRMEPWTFFLVASGFVWQLAHVLIASIIVGLYHEMLVPLGAPHANSQLTNAMGMVTGCLSLLLVFRTNSSYSRWWEARILWGSVVNLSRNYARQVMLWAPPERTSVARLGARWMAIAVHVMRAHLRQKHLGRVTQEASHLLTLDEFNWLAHWRSAPQGAAHVLAWSAANLGIDYQRERVLQDLIVTFINNLGACERILRTPMPTAYTRHTSRFLLVYITLAPAMLWPTTGWATPFCALLIGFLLLGTENIGVQIEEPFKVLPLDTICNTIENSIRDMELRHYGACSMDKLVSEHAGNDTSSLYVEDNG
ncbi:Bestrophin, RFP-TM, chloride channel-domain-containing protein [Haematococcus lacustris]